MLKPVVTFGRVELKLKVAASHSHSIVPGGLPVTS